MHLTHKINTHRSQGLSSRWFSQPIFNQLQALNGAATASGAAAGDRKSKSKSNAPVAGPDLPAHLNGGAGGVGGGRGRGEDEEVEVEGGGEVDGFEEVAASDSDLSSMDSEGEAECAAIGSLLLRKKIRKEELIDACYHRYSFNDSHLAPKWFQDDQKKFSKGQIPVTKEQIAEERARNMAIAARPIKKVMEAKARKKIKLVRAGQKAKNKADQVADDTDLTDKAKMRALQKLYDKGVSVKRPRSVTVIGRKGAMGKKGTKVVDKRMKKDHPSTTRPGNRNYKGGKKGTKAKAEMKVKSQAPKGGVRKRSAGAAMQANGKYR